VKLRRFLRFLTFFFKIQKTWLFTFLWVADHVFSNTGKGSGFCEKVFKKIYYSASA